MILQNGLPNLHFEKNIVYDVCQEGKKVRAYFNAKKYYFI